MGLRSQAALRPRPVGAVRRAARYRQDDGRSLLAKELGLELYRIDLSQVVNKYIGETEKNLGRVFDEAARGRSMLLFDEADSLFAKRTEVKSSNDRYANLEVNYLLQRMETHEGVVVMTTNAETAIDPAFRRRIRFRIRFPAPDEQQRLQLWHGMMPKEAQVAPDLDLRAIAQRFPLAGGNIMNALVRAATAAQADGSPIMQHHLAARRRARVRRDGLPRVKTPCRPFAARSRCSPTRSATRSPQPLAALAGAEGGLPLAERAQLTAGYLFDPRAGALARDHRRRARRGSRRRCSRSSDREMPRSSTTRSPR